MPTEVWQRREKRTKKKAGGRVGSGVFVAACRAEALNLRMNQNTGLFRAHGRREEGKGWNQATAGGDVHFLAKQNKRCSLITGLSPRWPLPREAAERKTSEENTRGPLTGREKREAEGWTLPSYSGVGTACVGLMRRRDATESSCGAPDFAPHVRHCGRRPH